MALLHCELRYGARFICDPPRWRDALGDDGTLDGCVPVRLVWAYFAAVSMGRAADAIDTARGIGLAFGDEFHGDLARKNAIDDAFPQT